MIEARKLADEDVPCQPAYSVCTTNSDTEAAVLRHLFLIGYDISSARRLRRALQIVKGHAVGGQKSLYECWMTVGELQEAMKCLRQLIDPEEDRVVFVQLDPRARVCTLGVAVQPVDGDFFYEG